MLSLDNIIFIDPLELEDDPFFNSMSVRYDGEFYIIDGYAMESIKTRFRSVVELFFEAWWNDYRVFIYEEHKGLFS